MVEFAKMCGLERRSDTDDKLYLYNGNDFVFQVCNAICIPILFCVHENTIALSVCHPGNIFCLYRFPWESKDVLVVDNRACDTKSNLYTEH